MATRPIVYVDFPKTGLGNLLLLWSRAVVFARINNLELITSPWWGFRWGALLRREQKKRLYWQYFKESTLAQLLKVKWQCAFYPVTVEPPVGQLAEGQLSEPRVFVFNTVMTDYNLFAALHGYEEIVAAEIEKLLHPSKKKVFMFMPVPVIGVHVRRGDFKFGSLLTSLDFFIAGISLIRKIAGEDLPVMVFSDAEKEELLPLLALPNVSLATEKADILDIIQLSKSKIMLLSAGSTFGYWGAFLSDAFVVRPKNDWLETIKNCSSANGAYKEMKWQFDEEGAASLLEANFREW